ncbi:MAG TPA: M13-type metalloendopeptidase, partial [Candidatus Methylomirabilis sp.]|nr:M13-type metalloendopeptidase [Candidatus Methylomirabilis sp.]
QVWCMNETPQQARLQALSNEHSDDRWRVNGVVSNVPEFAKAFGCKADAAMIRKPACRVW